MPWTRVVLSHVYEIGVIVVAVILIIFNWKKAKEIWAKFKDLTIAYKIASFIAILLILYFYLIFDLVFGVSPERIIEDIVRIAKRNAGIAACTLVKFSYCPKTPEEIAEDDWKSTRELGTVQAYETYLRNHPGAHSAEARSAIADIWKDDDDWSAAQKSGNVNAYESYLEKHPNGRHAVDVRNAIPELQKDYDDWRAAGQLGTPQAYETYLQSHPRGRYIAVARNQITEIRSDDLDWSAAQKKGTVNAYEAYIGRRALGRHGAEARKAISDEIRRDEEDWAITQARGTIEAYAAYVERHPEGRHIAAVRSTISDLRRREPFQIGYHSSFNAKCEVQAVPTAKIISAPTYGKLDFRLGPAIIADTRFGGVRQCVGKSVYSLLLYYVPNTRALGNISADSTTLELSYENDHRGKRAYRVRYRIDLDNRTATYN